MRRGQSVLRERQRLLPPLRGRLALEHLMEHLAHVLDVHEPDAGLHALGDLVLDVCRIRWFSLPSCEEHITHQSG